MPIKVNIKDVRQLEATLVEKYNVGKSLPGTGNFDDFINFGSYRINGSYTNAPNSTCGTNASLTASMIGTLNVFALGDNTAAITQQLFWLKDEVVNQYQRSYYNNGSNMTWTDWKKLIKCDDYATDTEIGGIKIGYNPDPGSPGNLPVRLGINDNLNKAFVVMTSRNIKQVLGVNNSNEYNGDDIFISGISTTNYSNDFDEILYIGSYKVNGTYSNAPKQNCGTSTVDTANMKGSLNVFRSGANDWETIQQLFWVRDDKTEQYQRSYDGATWTIWKRLIKCDDYADMDGNGGIISSANLQELFRSPDIIQLWNENGKSLAGGDYHLNTFLPITVTIENIIQFDGGINIIKLNPERVYRVTYDVNCIRVEGKGDVTIRIEDGNGELYSTTEFISNTDVRKRIAFSIMLTNLDYKIIPVINVESELVILINPYCYQVNVEEIRFPYFNPVPLTH